MASTAFSCYRSSPRALHASPPARRCPPLVGMSEWGEMLVRGRANDGLYPMGFYLAMSRFVSTNFERSVVLMRMFSWLIAVAGPRCRVRPRTSRHPEGIRACMSDDARAAWSLPLRFDQSKRACHRFHRGVLVRGAHVAARRRSAAACWRRALWRSPARRLACSRGLTRGSTW